MEEEITAESLAEGEEVAEKEAAKPNFWQRLAGIVRGSVRAELAPATEATKAEVTASTPNTAYLKTDAGAGVQAAPEEKKMAEETQVKETEKGAQPPATVKVELPPEFAAMVAKMAEMETKLAKQATLEAQVATLKAERDAAQEKSERQSYLEKATSYLALPIAATELADHLYKLAKAAPDEAKWFTGLLDAADNALVTADVYKELGSSITPETASPLEKAQAMVTKGEAKDIAEALAKLPAAEQATIVNQSRARANRR